jgi:hypothetical protein
MKLVKKFAVALLFVSALAVPTVAGDMETPGKTSPPPPPGSSIALATTTGTAETTTGTTDISSELLYDAYMAVLGLY